MTAMYAIVWGLIFGFAGLYLVEMDSAILNILGYGAFLMCGLSVLSLLKNMGR